LALALAAGGCQRRLLFLGSSLGSAGLFGLGLGLLADAFAGDVDHHRPLTGAPSGLVLQRVEHLDARLALHDQLTLLVFGPEVDLGEVTAVLAPAVAHPALAGQGVPRPHHLDEAHGVAAQLGAPAPIGEELAEDAHHQHAGGVDRGHALGLGEGLVDVHRVEVAAGAGVARELHPVDGRLHQRGELFSDADRLEIQFAGGHQALSFMARTTRVRRARKIRFPSSSRPSSSITAMSMRFPEGPMRSRTSATLVETRMRSPAKIGRSYSKPCSACSRDLMPTPSSSRRSAAEWKLAGKVGGATMVGNPEARAYSSS